MSDTVIKVENLSKSYTISHQNGERYTALRDVLSNGVKGMGNRLLGRTSSTSSDNASSEEFWALDDVSFEVKQGERVGIIGRNGAGKSTLLKILSRITEPTKGRVHIRGRVASLLEVGTGFHPELTGRENIYLNGAILGMSREEIRRKFDEIVAFAEVEKFLDTPVKRYSSGMYMRLAFAVAAHLEPEVLIVDEVLAVGDAAFQKKSLGKMGEIADQGRTVLFVSHNMAAIENLCCRGIVLENGFVQFDGKQTQAVTTYLQSGREPNDLKERTDRHGTGEIRCTSIQIKDAFGNHLEVVKSGQDLEFHLNYQVQSVRSLNQILVGISCKTSIGLPVFLHHNRLNQEELSSINNGSVVVCRISKLPLPPSIYTIGFSIMPNMGKDGTYFDSVEDAAKLTVIAGDYYGSGEVPPISHGVFLLNANWQVRQDSNRIQSI